MHDSADSPALSIVVPAYNEEQRLPRTLHAIVEFLLVQPYSSEIIVVDDGSMDGTVVAAESFAMNAPTIHILKRPHLGKAAAVRAGMLASRGENILFTDADLSTPIEAVEDLLAQRHDGYDLVIGSREGVSARRIGEPHYRHLMGRAFNWVVQILALPGIKDTQCGFKLISRKATERIVPKLLVSQPNEQISGPRVSAFDVELLFLARREGFRIAEVPVIWTHAPGSKVRPGIDSLRMLADVLAVRWNAILGRYN